ncbi:MAG TPA: TlpA disulfide reductase family protein [Bryobacteraceae bacterium]|nr:TlpA disulfide reductase family protein [Bryobacteraceae bacterium]
MRRVISALVLTAVAAVAGSTPRPAPALTINIPNGSPVQLSQFKGKVTVVEFLLTTCPHCQNAAQMMSRLQNEYGPKGFQSLGVAFNDMAQMLVPDFVRDYKVNYPVGHTTREVVYSFLQNDPKMSLHVPQIVIIDRNGVIRHQSLPREDTVTATEKFLRENIERLLKEPAARVRKAPAAAKKAAAKAAS